MIGGSKNNRENYPRKAFEHKKEKPGLNLTFEQLSPEVHRFISYWEY